jgi:DNA-binding LytR/AlgR family response regulator
MPRMTGAELARHISAMRPGLPVLLATGYSELSGNDAAGLRRIEKPYRMEKLAATIESMVDQPERHTIQIKG